MSLLCNCIYGFLALVASAWVILKLLMKWRTGMCLSKARVDDKIVVITGGTGGIGRETAEELARRGAKHIVITGRDTTKGEKAAQEIQAINSKCKVEFYALDLCHMCEVKKFATYLNSNLSHLDILVNNAGSAIYKKVITSDGLESVMAGNYFGHFLLTHQLLPLIKKSTFQARIINVSSIAYKKRQPLDFDNLNSEKHFFGFEAYSASKLAQVYHTRKLCREFSTHKVKCSVFSLHPGVIATDVWRNVPFPLNIIVNLLKSVMKSSKEGAQTTIYCCVEPDLDFISGVYFADCKPDLEVKYKSEDLENKLWNISRQLLHIED